MSVATPDISASTMPAPIHLESQNPTAPFFSKLPTEIREKIYHYAFDGETRMRNTPPLPKSQQASTEQISDQPRVINVGEEQMREAMGKMLHREEINCLKAIDLSPFIVNKQFYNETHPIAIEHGRIVISIGTRETVTESHGFLQLPWWLSISQKVAGVLRKKLCPELEIRDYLGPRGIQHYRGGNWGRGLAEDEADSSAKDIVLVTWEFRNHAVRNREEESHDSRFYGKVLECLINLQSSTSVWDDYEHSRLFVQEKRLSELTPAEKEIASGGAAFEIRNGWVFRPISELGTNKDLRDNLANRLARERAQSALSIESPKTTSPFFDKLPAEIRDKIYRLAYEGEIRIRGSRLKTLADKESAKEENPAQQENSNQQEDSAQQDDFTQHADSGQRETSAEDTEYTLKVLNIKPLLVSKQFYSESHPNAIKYGRIVIPCFNHETTRIQSYGWLSSISKPFQVNFTNEVLTIKKALHAEIEMQDHFDPKGCGPPPKQQADLKAPETFTVTWQFRKGDVQHSEEERDSEYYLKTLQVLVLMLKENWLNEQAQAFVQEKRASEVTATEQEQRSRDGTLDIRDGWTFLPLSALAENDELASWLANRLASERAQIPQELATLSAETLNLSALTIETPSQEETKKTTSSFFARFPAEIRGKIYRFAYEGEIRLRDSAPNTETGEEEEEEEQEISTQQSDPIQQEKTSASQIQTKPKLKVINITPFLISKQFYSESHPIALKYGRVILPFGTQRYVENHRIGPVCYKSKSLLLGCSDSVASLVKTILHAEIEIQDDAGKGDKYQEPPNKEVDFRALDTITATWAFRKGELQFIEEERDSEYYYGCLQCLLIFQGGWVNDYAQIVVQEKRVSEQTPPERKLVEDGTMEIRDGWIYRRVSDLDGHDELTRKIADRLAKERAGEEYTDHSE